jgi:hypothetical protein
VCRRTAADTTCRSCAKALERLSKDPADVKGLTAQDELRCEKKVSARCAGAAVPSSDCGSAHACCIGAPARAGGVTGAYPEKGTEVLDDPLVVTQPAGDFGRCLLTAEIDGGAGGVFGTTFDVAPTDLQLPGIEVEGEPVQGSRWSASTRAAPRACASPTSR